MPPSTDAPRKPPAGRFLALVYGISLLLGLPLVIGMFGAGFSLGSVLVVVIPGEILFFWAMGYVDYRRQKAYREAVRSFAARSHKDPSSQPGGQQPPQANTGQR